MTLIANVHELRVQDGWYRKMRKWRQWYLPFLDEDDAKFLCYLLDRYKEDGEFPRLNALQIAEQMLVRARNRTEKSLKIEACKLKLGNVEQLAREASDRLWKQASGSIIETSYDQEHEATISKLMEAHRGHRVA